MTHAVDWIGELQPAVATVTAEDQFPPITLLNWQAPDYDPIFRERMRRLENIRNSGDARAVWHGLREFYKTHPMQFIDDWCVTADPRNIEIGLPVLTPFVLFKRQREFIEWLYERWRNREDGLVEKCRDAGVSWLCCAFAVWMWLFHDGAGIGFGSRKEEYVDKIGDPKSLFWKLRKIVEFLPNELKPVNWNERTDAPSMRMINRARDSSITGEAGDNIGRGARTSIYFVDEAAHLEHPEAVDAALSATSNCKIHVSSVNGAGNPFYKKRHGGQIPVFIFDWRQDPRKSQEWYDKQKATLDPVILAQEIDRNYEASVANAFIPAELVAAAAARGPRDVPARGRLRIGVDVARFGDDKTSIVFRRGRVMIKKVRLEKNDTMQVASKVRAEINAFNEKPEQIAVDTIGIGAGVADILRGWYPDVIGKDGKTYKTVEDINCSVKLNNGEHYNVRAMMWSEMKEWLKGASIPNDQNLRSDLTALRYSFRAGELLLESKDEAKKRGIKSPDDGDALALTFAVPTMAMPEPPKAKIIPYVPYDQTMGM